MRKLWFRTVCAAVCLAVMLGSTGSLSGLREAVAAGATRVAVVTSLKGDVQVKKAGGAKYFDAFKNMSLNEGDMITTGKNSSVVLELASSKADQDTITVGENSQVQFTKLKEDTGTKAKMSVWAGSLWVKVKSISNAEDTFEVETPTAIMGVRGTHFALQVDPLTGRVILVVTSGVMAASSTQSAAGGSGTRNVVNVYPTQQMEIDHDLQTEDPRALVGLADPETLVLTLPANIIEAMVSNMADIRQENAELARQLAGSVQEGDAAPDPNANLLIASDEDLNAYSQNMIALLVVILAEAVNKGILSEEMARDIVDNINEVIDDPVFEVRLDNVPEYRKDAGTDPALEAQREKARQQREEQERQKEQRRQELLDQNRDKAREISEKKSQLEEANQAAKNERVQEALDKYKESLSEEEKAQLEQRVRQREQERQEQTGGNTGTGTGGGSSPGTTTPGATVAASVSDYDPYTKTVDIKLSGFTGNKAVFGYQLDVTWNDDRITFAEPLFRTAASGELNPFRNVQGSPFRTELDEYWSAPAGYEVNAVDHVETDGNHVRYAVLKFTGGAETVNGQTVVRLPFVYSTFTSQVTVTLNITLTAVDANGNAISGIPPVTAQVVIEPESVKYS